MINSSKPSMQHLYLVINTIHVLIIIITYWTNTTSSQLVEHQEQEKVYLKEKESLGEAIFEKNLLRF